MELRHLRYFVAVAEEMGFTRAAAKLRLAQPSLTRQIHNLEEELGVFLLDRTKNQVVLTGEGKSFLVDAKRLVALSLESVKSVQRFSRGESSRLSLGYLFKFHYDLLPATLTTLYQDCPEIAVSLFDMSPTEQFGALEARKIDLGFVGWRPADTSQKMAAFNWECVAHHDVVVVLPTRHSLAKQKRIKIGDLKSLFFVTLSDHTHPGSREWLSGLCQEAGFIPRILQEVELESSIMTFVADGLGVALAREPMKNLPQPGVVFRPLATPTKADYWIAWHSENRSRALGQFIEILKTHQGHSLNPSRLTPKSVEHATI